LELDSKESEENTVEEDFAVGALVAVFIILSLFFLCLICLCVWACFTGCGKKPKSSKREVSQQ